MRVDLHHHILPPLYMDALRFSGVDRSSGINFPPWHPEDSLAVMDRHGIDTAVVSVSTPGVAFGTPAEARALARRCNQWAAELVAAHPGRFRAFACLPLPDVDGALAETSHGLDELGLDGVVLLASAGDRYLGDAAFEALFEELGRRRTVAFVHPTTPPGAPLPGLDVPVHAIEFVADTTRAAANLIFSGTLERHPGVNFVFAHAGGFAPYIASRLQLAWEGRQDVRTRAPSGVLASLARCHYDTAVSASPYALPSVLALAGPEHLLLGTDFPFVPEAVVAWTLDGLSSLDAGERAGVEGGNATRLLPALTRGRGAPAPPVG